MREKWSETVIRVEEYIRNLPEGTLVYPADLGSKLDISRQLISLHREEVESLAEKYKKRLASRRESSKRGSSIRGEKQRAETDSKVAPFLNIDASLS